jgi:nickel transport protein
MTYALRLVILLALMASCLCLAVPASAHKVNVFAYVEKGEIVGEGYFSDGTKAQLSSVIVEDASGKELAKTTTGKDGGFRLPLPKAAPPLTVYLFASEGHENTYTLSAADIDPDAGEPAAQAPAQAASQASGQVPPAAVFPAQDAAQAVAPAWVAAAVDQAVAARLDPIKAQLARLAEQGDRVSAKDVFGGLGWIIGIFGTAAYIASRRNGGGS